jgi:uncharacterized membrane-anchored protein YhcB (DUF1043 family)
MAEDMNNDHQDRMKTIESDGENEDEEGGKQVPAEDQQPEKTLEDEFREVYDKVVNDPNADADLIKNLTLFMDGARNARNAEKKVEEAYIGTEKLFEKSKTTILEAAVPLYEYLSTHMDQLEADIIAHFSETHELRKSILIKFDVLNKSFKQTYEDLIKRLVPGNHEAIMMSTAGLGDGPTTHHGEEENGDEAGNKMETDGSGELDWEDIVSLCPTLKDCVEKFIAGREEWAAAVEGFTKALDTADEKIGKRQQHMLETLANAHSTIYDNLAESQESLMRLFVDNHVKRATLEEHLQRKASQQTKFFQRLMQSVKGPGGHQSSKVPAAAAGTTTVKPESLTPAGQKGTTRYKLSSMRKVFKIGGKGKKRAADSQDPPTDA